MDYLKVLKGLDKEFKEAGRAKYTSMSFVPKLFWTLFMIPARIAYIFANVFYWLTWFFFKGFAAPVDYLQAWLDKQTEKSGEASKAVINFVCLPLIFSYQLSLAFSSFIFFCQWFELMVLTYVATLGAVRWQPVITEATFEE